MSTILKKLRWLSVLLVLAVSTAMAQPQVIAVDPGTKGKLPEAPKLATLEVGQFAGLELVFVNEGLAAVRYPVPARYA